MSWSERENGGLKGSLSRWVCRRACVFALLKLFGPFSLHDGVDDWWRRESLLNEERLGAHGREKLFDVRIRQLITANLILLFYYLSVGELSQRVARQ